MTLSAEDLMQVSEVARLMSVEVLRNATRGTGGASLPIPVFRAASVGGQALPGETVTVIIDGDDDGSGIRTTLPVHNATGVVLGGGDRVLVAFLPPQGTYAVSCLGPGPETFVAAATPWTTETGATTALVDVAGATVSFVARAGRQYRYTHVNHYTATALGDVVRFWLVDGAGVAKGFPQAKDYICAGANTASGLVDTRIESNVTPGIVTRKLQIVRASGTGTVVAFADATRQGFLTVEDIGPAVV